MLDACSPENFDQSVVPGAKSTIDSKSAELFQNCLRKLYSKLYPLYKHLFREHEVFIPSTYRKYSNIKWHGKKLTSLLNKNATNCLVFLVPPFPFTSGITWEFNGQERLAENEYFLVHTISIPGEAEPKSHLLACLKWPMIHRERNHFGKPVEVWCNSVFEPQPANNYCLASNILHCTMICSELLYDERVRIAIAYRIVLSLVQN